MKAQGAVERRFDLNGALLGIEAADAALIAPLLPWLGELSVPPPAPGAAGFRASIARETPQAVPGDARLLYDGPLPEGTPCRLSMDGDWRWLVVPPDRLCLRFSTGARRAHMQVAPGAEALIGGSSGVFLLDAALTASQQIMIHAAALRLPQRDAAIGLLAPSGAGKTTTALALALKGFAYMADDATVLAPAGAGAAPRIWGLPRALKVHRRTAAMLPQVGRLLGSEWNAEDEQSVSRTALRSVIEVLPPRPVPLAAFIVLGPRVAGEHRLRPIPKSDLLAHFASDNIFCSREGVLDAELARYQSIARTVVASPALELNVGSDLGSLSACILAALGQPG